MENSPLITTVEDGRLIINVDPKKLRYGPTNMKDVEKFVDEFMEKLENGADFTMTCSPNCKNSCQECVLSILKLTANNAS